jgi:hypothetical protein
VPMLIAILIWNSIHPGRYMQGPNSKLPPSWLSRKLCCCCHRKGKSRGGHERLGSNADYEELKALRSREPSPAPSERVGEQFDYRYPTGDTLNVREPFRPHTAYNPPSRGTSPARPPPEPTSWPRR